MNKSYVHDIVVVVNEPSPYFFPDSSRMHELVACDQRMPTRIVLGSIGSIFSNMSCVTVGYGANVDLRTAFPFSLLAYHHFKQ